MVPRVVVENRFGLRKIQGTIQDLGINDSNSLPAKIEHTESLQTFTLERIRPTYVLYRQLVETKGE